MNTKPITVAMMLVRDEQWVLGFSLRAALQWADSVVVLDHLSTDATPDIVAQVASENPGRVHTQRITGEGWSEMDQRQKLLDMARTMPRPWASVAAIVDADEIMSHCALPHAPRWLAAVKPGTCTSLPMVSPYHGLDNCRVDGSWGHSKISWAVGLGSGIYYRPREGGYQLHHRHPMGLAEAPRLPDGGMMVGQGGIVHLQFVDRTRLAWKALYYKLLERTLWPDKYSVADLNRIYGWTLQDSGRQLEPFGPHHLLDYGPELNALLDHTALPWQAGAARALLAKHGSGVLAGLDTYGLPL